MKLRSLFAVGSISLAVLFGTSSLKAEKYIGKDVTTDKTNSSANSQGKTSSTNSLLAGCVEPNDANYIEFNNVRALIYTGGDMFWDFGTGLPAYEIPKPPKGTRGPSSMFLASLWLGGTDVNGQLRIAAQRYRGAGVDYWTGPLDTSGSASVSAETCAEWDQHFIITRQEVDEFAAWCNDKSSNPSYTIPKSLLDWPAHGDESKGQSYYLAPFYDANGDSYYDPQDCDYPFYELQPEEECNRSRDRNPKLFGDYTMWYIFNDKGNVHKETEGDAIGLEIQAQQFAFATNDEINNMTFTNYRILNRSTFTLVDTYFGTNFDSDIGDPFDDYVGCDVKRGLGYGYNGPAVDGSGGPGHYGENPPAIGVDFFEGPFQDPDGLDNPKDSACNAYINGSINGLNFGDGELDNERWGMRRLVYYCNPGIGGCQGATQGDPVTAVHYYNYLRGYWKDNTRMRYGGNGHVSNCTSCEYADFMFPGAKSNPQNTDACNWGVCSDPDGQNCGVTPGDNVPWTEQAAGNTANDRRFVHSAGPFTLAPGADNDITVGIIWERATSTDPFQSVELVRLADDKAQALFDNCFRVLNGPDAPTLTCQETSREIILYLSNPKTSNNYLEEYHEVDPLIVAPDSVPAPVDNEYRFQGYQIYQLKNATVSVSDLEDIELARLVAQVDIKDSVAKLVNWIKNEAIGEEVPTLMVEGANNGISHSFRITEDEFALGDKKLVNHKKYYFIALAYAYNQYLIYTYNINNPIGNGNKIPYLAGRKTGLGGSIEAIECVPHKVVVESYGTEINSKYGDSPELTRIEGHGNGGRNLELSQSTINTIMSGPPWKATNLTYQQGAGPIDVKVIDPLKVQGGTFAVKLYYDTADAISITSLNYTPSFTAGISYFVVTDDVTSVLSAGDKFNVSGSTQNIVVTSVDSTNDGKRNAVYTVVSHPFGNETKIMGSGFASGSYNSAQKIIANTGTTITTTAIFDPTNTGAGLLTGSNDRDYTVLKIANSTKIYPEEWIQVNTTDGMINPYYRWALVKGTNFSDTVTTSVRPINVKYEQLIDDLGISITMEQVMHPGPTYSVPQDITSNFSPIIGTANPDVDAAGFISGSLSFANGNKAWLTGVIDGDAPNALNWIKVGTAADDYKDIDNDEVLESILGGTWAPFRIASKDSLGPGYKFEENDRTQLKNTYSIDLVITSDRTKWTRAAVLEQEEIAGFVKPFGSNIPKLNLRAGLSIDKNGTQFDTTGYGNLSLSQLQDEIDTRIASGTIDTSDENSAAYVHALGMGWFPGYAINIETGERLNIMYGEDSWLINGNDMIWNPTSNLTGPLGEFGLENGFGSIGCDPNVSFGCYPYWAGGKHFIYVVGHNGDDRTDITQGRGDVPAYDNGAYIRKALDRSPADDQKVGVFKDVMWVGLPLLEDGYSFDNPLQIPTTATIKLRMAQPYSPNYSTDSMRVDSASMQNNNNPMYTFSLDALAATTNVTELAVKGLEHINVVPNPYYAFNAYERTQIDHKVKIINLPVTCTVSIYSINGTLIRKFERDDNTITSIDWDLKNEKSVPIAGGVYLIHVNAPGLGERVLKWFGVLRPVDLDSF